MPSTINKQRVLNQFFTTLKKRYDPAEPAPQPVLEQFIYAILREGAPRAQADQAFANLRERFFDWNEVRVSSPREVEDALADLPEAEQRANRLISLLQEVFETTFSFDLDQLHKKGLKQAAKQLARYQAANDYIVAYVTQQGLNGHALPLDGPALRLLRRLGFIEEETGDLEALRAGLEHLIPKARGFLFSELVSSLAHDYCFEADPNCSACPLASECPTAQEGVPAELETARLSRPKPR
jgi:endonuclease-3